MFSSTVVIQDPLGNWVALRMVSTTSGLGYIQGALFGPLFESQSMNTIPNYRSLWALAHWWHDAVPSSIDDSSVTAEVRATLSPYPGRVSFL